MRMFNPMKKEPFSLMGLRASNLNLFRLFTVSRNLLLKLGVERELFQNGNMTSQIDN